MTFRRDWLDPARHALFGYPPGHRHYEPNPLLRLYPLAVTILVLSTLVRACL